MEQRTRRIIVWSIAGVVVIVAGVIGGVMWWLKSDVARPVDIDDVLADFRANSSSTTAPPTRRRRTTTRDGHDDADQHLRRRLHHERCAGHDGGGTTTTQPAALPIGVYVYTTTGDEGVDALGGDEHPYPATTTMTVTDSARDASRSAGTPSSSAGTEAQYCPGARRLAPDGADDLPLVLPAERRAGVHLHTAVAAAARRPAAGDTFTASCNSPGTGTERGQLRGHPPGRSSGSSSCRSATTRSTRCTSSTTR